MMGSPVVSSCSIPFKILQHIIAGMERNGSQFGNRDNVGIIKTTAKESILVWR